MYVSAVITNGYPRKGEYNLIALDVIARIGGGQEKFSRLKKVIRKPIIFLWNFRHIRVYGIYHDIFYEISRYIYEIPKKIEIFGIQVLFLWL